MENDDLFFRDVADGPPSQRAEGEVPLDTLAEGSARRRGTAKNRTAQRQTDHNLSRIISQAAEGKPHHRDRVMRSLQSFTRAMMGLPVTAKPGDLPAAVSADEHTSWATWRDRRKEAFKKQLQDATAKNPDANEQELKHIHKGVIDQLKSRLIPVMFRPSNFAVTSTVSLHVKRDMEAELAKQGFPRFTFDWNATHVEDTLWNSITVDITLRHWLAWAKRLNLDVSEASLPGIKTRFYQWIRNQGLSRTKAQQTPAEIGEQRAYSQYVRSQKRKVATLRADTFLQLYPSKKILGHLLRDPDAVSDFEDDDETALPLRVRAHWRSTEMEDIIRALDRVSVQRARSAQKKISVKGLLERRATREPTDEERVAATVPNRFPRDAYSPTYLAEVGEFHTEYITSEAMALDKLAEEMKSKSGGGPMPQVGGAGVDPAAPTTGNQAGTSSEEVQMAE